MQNAGIAALGLNWRYLAFDVKPDDLRDAIRGAMTMKFIGLNLTVPHKLLAMEMVDELDPSAEQWGAVNTLRFELSFPFRYSTSAAISPDGMEVLIRRYSSKPETTPAMFNAPPETAASYWRRPDASISLVDLLRQAPEILPLAVEPQGEAITFSWDGRGFYTTTERGMGASAIPASPLTFYERS